MLAVVLLLLAAVVCTPTAQAAVGPPPVGVKPVSPRGPEPVVKIGQPVLDGKPATSGNLLDLDPRCRAAGRTLCASKATNRLFYLIDGRVQLILDARFGDARGPSYRTVTGTYSIYYKHADHVSSIYGDQMPYSMFFYRGQAIHFSYDFAAVGYDGASHGCINTRDLAATGWLYDQIPLGTRIVIY